MVNADPTAGSWGAWAEEQGRLIAEAGQWRSPRDLDAAGPAGTLRTPDGDRAVVSFASNDYLGLTQHPAGRAAAVAALERWGTGSGAARLIVGARPVHRQLEEELAAWRSTEAAVLFPTGFAANLGVLTVVGTTGVRIVSDELNHASIIDGTRLARGEVVVAPHADVDGLEAAVAGAPGRTVVVTDTVFSMDGDLAPLAAVADVCRRHRSLLVLDEAHAVLGPDPAPDVLHGVDVLRVGTLSKTLGSLGGFVAGPRRFTDLLVNRARSFIFTTASTPADTAAALANLRVVRSDEGDALRARLRAHVEVLAPGHPSPILPVIVGDERDAVAASAALLERGLLVPAIRPPTVPAGTSRLRIALSAAHTTAQVTELAAALDDLGLAVHRGPVPTAGVR